MKVKRLSLFVAFIMLFFVVQGCKQDTPSSNIQDPNPSVEEEAVEEEGNIEDDTQTGDDNDTEDVSGEVNQEDQEADSSQSLVYVSANKLNVRRAPDPAAGKIATLMKGSGVQKS